MKNDLLHDIRRRLEKSYILILISAQQKKNERVLEVVVGTDMILRKINVACYEAQKEYF